MRQTTSIILVFLVFFSFSVKNANSQVTNDYARLTRILAQLGVDAKHGINQIAEGLSRNMSQAFRQSPALREAVHAGGTTRAGMVRQLTRSKELAREVTRRVTRLGKLGYSGDKLAMELAHGNTWSILGKRTMRAGFATLEVLNTLMGYVLIAEVTQAAIDAAFAEYDAEMESMGYAAEQEAYNWLALMMLTHLKDGRLHLREGLTLADALKLLRQNMQSETWPYTGIFKETFPREAQESQGEQEEKIPGSCGEPGTVALYTLVDPPPIQAVHPFARMLQAKSGSRLEGECMRCDRLSEGSMIQAQDAITAPKWSRSPIPMAEHYAHPEETQTRLGVYFFGEDPCLSNGRMFPYLFPILQHAHL
jgi:hypothetical protein